MADEAVNGGIGRRRFLGVAAGVAGALAMPGIASAQPREATVTDVTFLGSYTDNGGDGLQLASTNLGTGVVKPGAKVPSMQDASWLVYSADRSILYTTNELSSGTMTALKVNGSSQPTILNKQATKGGSPAHASVHPSGKYLMVANYDSGSVAILPIKSDGSLGALTDLVVHSGGTGGDPHAHQILTDPSGKWVLSVDLGTDSVYVYTLNLSTGKLTLHSQTVLAKGDGPRHLVFHPNGTRGFLATEDSSQVIAFAWDSSAGKLTVGQIVGTTEPGAVTPNYPGEIALSQDATFLYVSNRGDNSIATFSVSADGSTVTLLNTAPCGGDWPRHFALDPTEHWFVVANQNSGTVTWLPRDQQTGLPGTVAGTAKATAVAMVLF
jgi:6-phosphogluconolactonase (cycloisomerase 2 family)